MREYLEKSMTYDEYRKLVEKLADNGKTTGKTTPDTIYFTNLNRQRMRRLDKTVKIGDELKAKVKAVKRPLIWLILTESWCGDAAQNIPVIEKIAGENPLIQTRYLLRDENPELMDRYLTNGGRAIPILICLDGETLQELGKWGSRPTAIQQYFLELKASGMEKPQIIELLQRRYNTDKEQSIQDDFMRLLGNFSDKSIAAKS